MFGPLTRTAKRKLEEASWSQIGPALVPPPVPPARIGPVKNSKAQEEDDMEGGPNAQTKLERIFKDLNDIWMNIRMHEESVRWKALDPLRDFSNWPRNDRERFKEACDALGLEFLVVAMWSKTFVASLKGDSTTDWTRLRVRVAAHKMALRTFAITRQIRYFETYQNSSMPEDFGPLDDFHPMARTDQQRAIKHPHLVYEEADGGIKPTRFLQGLLDLEMTHADENIYSVARLSRGPRPQSWPQNWKFPCNPTTANQAKEGPYGTCESCDLRIVSWPEMRALIAPHCTCTREDYEEPPIVAIKALPSYQKGELNRGVIALSPIDEYTILGEYVGVFINPARSPFEYDDTYVFEFNGPQTRGGKEWDLMPSTCKLSAAEGGNWTRFINHTDDEAGQNVEFKGYAIGGQLRIVAISTRKIELGEQLLTNYGPNYFQKDEDVALDADGDIGMSVLDAEGDIEMSIGQDSTHEFEVFHPRRSRRTIVVRLPTTEDLEPARKRPRRRKK